MAWLTVTDSTNLHQTIRYDYEYRYQQISLFGAGVYTQKQKRPIIVTESKYVGVAITSAATLTATLSTTGASSTVEVSAWFEDNGNGSATLYHVTTDRSAAWGSAA